MVDLEFRAISKRYEDGTCAVRGMSFTAPGGCLTTVLGPSGSGKSTLLRIAAGLETPSEGQVLIDGKDVTALRAAERNISMLFQNTALFPHLNVIDNVAFGLRHAGVDRQRAKERARAMLDLLGMAGFEQRSTSELSGGQQQRVALARALAPGPTVMLLDEPLSNLDDRLKRQLREEIRSLQQRLELTMAYVTHDEAEAMAVSDHVVVMNEGRLLQIGTPCEVYQRPCSEFVAEFMGDAAVFEVTVDEQGRVALGSLRLRLPLPPQQPLAQGLRLIVRPEAWRIFAVGGDGMAGRITRCAYLGHGVEYVVETEIGDVLVTTWHAEALHQPGAPVTLSLGSEGVTVLGEETPRKSAARVPEARPAARSPSLFPIPL